MPKRAGWLPAMFFLESAAIILTVSAMRHMLGQTGEYGPIAGGAIAIWTPVLVGLTIMTVVVWRRLPTSADRSDWRRRTGA